MPILNSIPDLVDAIGISIDGGGIVLSTGSKGYREIPYNCTIVGWTLVSDQTGSIQIDVKKANYAGFPTTSSIAGSEKPTLSASQKNTDQSLTTWTVSLSQGDILEFYIDSASSVTKIQLFLKIRKR